MASQRPERSDPETWPAWPYASLLLFGMFGAADETGRRAASRGVIGLAGLMLGLGLMSGETVYTVGALLMVSAIAFLVWSTAVYIRSLDELSRLIQLEAFAWSYGFVFLLCFLAVAVGGGPTGVSVNPGLILIGEFIRGIALVAVARRYR